MSEIERVGAETNEQVLTSIYFGGGTPSLMHPDSVLEILEATKRTWRLANDVEITLEANPTSIETERFKGYRDAGVNRVSIGVQSLNGPDLAALGRLHSVDEALTALDKAMDIFDRVSFDLIYARQKQTLSDWREELSQALAVGVSHLSLYQLTVEPGTAFGDRLKNGTLGGLPSDDNSADMYCATQELCSAAGLDAYEVSNHARPGHESKHNMIYWTGRDYAGIGPGAHGRLSIYEQRIATETYLAPTKWLDRVKTSGSGESLRSVVPGVDRANEYLMMGLRINQGISVSKLNSLGAGNLDPAKTDYLKNLGMVVVDDDRLRTTPAGRQVLNSVVKELMF